MTNPKRSAETDLSEPVEPATWPYEALKRFRLIFRAAQLHAQSVEASLGVSSAQLWALSELSECPGLKVAELAEAMSVHQSTISNLMAKLERKGLIRRERSDADQRVVRLYLTEEGQALMGRAPEHRQGLLQHALFELPDPVLASLTQNLDLLIDAMEIRDREAAMQPLSVAGTSNAEANPPSFKLHAPPL